MEIKGRTQNIKLESDIRLTGSEMILSNVKGFKLIVSNLISNAIKYSFERNTVSVSVSTNHGFLDIIVEDWGIGMTEEQLGKLFRKYGKMNDEKAGQGIGLFMVNKLVDHFEGTIHVESRLNHGTRVKVSLPLH